MATTQSSSLGQATATVFTAVVAPVLVSVILHGMNLAGSGPAQAGGTCKPSLAETRDILVSHGLGNTPDAARDDALRHALLVAVRNVVVPQTPLPAQRAVCEAMLREPGKVILRCEHQGCVNESSFGKSQFRAEITVEMAREPLIEHLQRAALQLQ